MVHLLYLIILFLVPFMYLNLLLIVLSFINCDYPPEATLPFNSKANFSNWILILNVKINLVLKWPFESLSLPYCTSHLFLLIGASLWGTRLAVKEKLLVTRFAKRELLDIQSIIPLMFHSWVTYIDCACHLVLLGTRERKVSYVLLPDLSR